MRRFGRGGFLAISIAVLAAAVSPQARPQAASPNTVPITTVVTVLGKNSAPPPVLSKDDITVREGQVRREVLNWIPAQGDKAGLQLAIVIDDSLRKTFGAQIQPLTEFITSQPQSTSVGVFYASSGTVQVASQFNPDLAAVAKTVRVPSGTYGAASSIYQSLMQLIAGWPVTGARREILLFSDGFDYLRKDRFSPDVQLTIDKAQQAGIVIHAIYAASAGRPGFSKYVVSVGQGNLNRITDGTGGFVTFASDTPRVNAAPLSASPYLSQLSLMLKNQYFLTFATNRSKSDKGDYRGIKVLTERRDVEIKAADNVFVPGGGK
ncbi:MAG: hypothetical protein ACRD59_06910 [Candidatus Acidiferrales bacterium]